MNPDPFAAAMEAHTFHDDVMARIEQARIEDDWNPLALNLAAKVLDTHRPSCCSNYRCSVGDKTHCLHCEGFNEVYGTADDYYVHWPCDLAQSALAFLGLTPRADQSAGGAAAGGDEEGR